MRDRLLRRRVLHVIQGLTLGCLLVFGFSEFRRYENADIELEVAKSLVNGEEIMLRQTYSSSARQVLYSSFEPQIRNEINLSYRPKMPATSADKVYIVKVRARILVFFVKGNRVIELYSGLT